MNIIEISCPSKTFLVGEYAVLDGGSAIILNTEPRFVCHLKKITKPQAYNIPVESPAGQWIQKNPQDFHCVSMEWSHEARKNHNKLDSSSKQSLSHDSSAKKIQSGLGFSSAQFNILYAYSFILREGHIDHLKPQELWRNYRNLRFDGFQPSGADIITQWVGGLSVFEQDPLHVETLTSYFPDLECLILKAGEPLKTHEYLKNFKMSDMSQLKQIAKSAVTSMKQKNREEFVSNINEYRKALEEKGYITETSKNILKKIEKIKTIEAFKACGTMGAETILVFYNKKDDKEVRQALSFLEIIADSDDLTYGISFTKKTKKSELSS